MMLMWVMETFISGAAGDLRLMGSPFTFSFLTSAAEIEQGGVKNFSSLSGFMDGLLLFITCSGVEIDTGLGLSMIMLALTACSVFDRDSRKLP